MSACHAFRSVSLCVMLFWVCCPEQHSHCLLGALCVKQRQESWAGSTGPAASAAVILQWRLRHPAVAVVSLAKPAQICWSTQPRHSSPAVWISCARSVCALECLSCSMHLARATTSNTVHIHTRSFTCCDSRCHQLSCQCCQLCALALLAPRYRPKTGIDKCVVGEPQCVLSACLVLFVSCSDVLSQFVSCSGDDVPPCAALMVSQPPCQFSGLSQLTHLCVVRLVHQCACLCRCSCLLQVLTPNTNCAGGL